jgi:hypoxanthine phosphoribosyltransferase
MERETLKLALEALEEYADQEGKTRAADEAITALKAALAQPVQEPVACVQDLDEVKRKHLVYEKGMDWKDPLYTTPPKREWVGLTKEEVRQCGFAVPFDGAQDWALRFYKAIEAKLKEKNT